MRRTNKTNLKIRITVNRALYTRNNTAGGKQYKSHRTADQEQASYTAYRYINGGEESAVFINNTHINITSCFGSKCAALRRAQTTRTTATHCLPPRQSQDIGHPLQPLTRGSCVGLRLSHRVHPLKKQKDQLMPVTVVVDFLFGG